MNRQFSYDRRRIAVCGPMSGIPTGQGAALAASIQAIGSKVVAKVDTGGTGLRLVESISKALVAVVKLAIAVGWRKVRVVYVTPSRSFLGAVRESPIVFIAHLSKCRLIAHWHGAEFHYLHQKPGCLLARVLFFLWRLADTHIALCETMRSELQQFGFRDVRVIPNFCDLPTQFSKVPTNKNEPLRLLYFSNLIPEKGVLDAIRTHQELRQSGVVTELHIVGARIGRLPNEVEESFKCEGIVYHGPLYGPQKLTVLSSCDVLLFPSVYRSEAFPLTLLEAMSAGLAVVAYRHNYISDFFNPSGGYLVPCRLNEMVSAVTRLCHDFKYLDKCKVANRIAARTYSTEKYNANIRKLFQLQCI